MATTIYMLYYVVQKTSFEITFKFLYGLMYGIKEAIQPYMSYAWFPRNIYGGHPGFSYQPILCFRKNTHTVTPLSRLATSQLC